MRLGPGLDVSRGARESVSRRGAVANTELPAARRLFLPHDEVRTPGAGRAGYHKYGSCGELHEKLFLPELHDESKQSPFGRGSGRVVLFSAGRLPPAVAGHPRSAAMARARSSR